MPNVDLGFQLAAPSPGSGGKIPPTIERAQTAAYDELQGALVFVNAADEFEACAADANVIAGVAISAGGPVDGTSFTILGENGFPTGYMQAYAIARGVKFIAPYVGDLPAAPGGEYGFIKDVDGVYKIDFNDVINVCLKYLGVPDLRPDLSAANEGFAECVFLDSVVQDI